MKKKCKFILVIFFFILISIRYFYLKLLNAIYRWLHNILEITLKCESCFDFFPDQIAHKLVICKKHCNCIQSLTTETRSISLMSSFKDNLTHLLGLNSCEANVIYIRKWYSLVSVDTLQWILTGNMVFWMHVAIFCIDIVNTIQKLRLYSRCF